MTSRIRKMSRFNISDGISLDINDDKASSAVKPEPHDKESAIETGGLKDSLSRE
jgi:hypothetical protein